MDVGDVKKILQALKGQKLEGKIVDSTKAVAQREEQLQIKAKARGDREAIKRSSERVEAAMDRQLLLQTPANYHKFPNVVDATKRIEDKSNAEQLKDWENFESWTTLSREDQAYNELAATVKREGLPRQKTAEMASEVFDHPSDVSDRLKSLRGADVVDRAVVKMKPTLEAVKPVRVAHPFNPKEVFQFPPGTDEKSAKDLVRQILLKRAREGEEQIELPSKLAGDDSPE